MIIRNSVMCKLKNVFGLSFAGLAAGIGFFLASPFFRRHLGEGLDGVIFGMALALYFLFFRKERSIWKVAAIIVSSTVAFGLAIMATSSFYSWSFERFDRNPMNYGNLPAYVMFPGGIVGAFCVCGTALLLYSPSKRNLLSKILLCSIGGGIISVLALMIGNAMKISNGTLAGAGFLFLVWPAAVGAFLGMTLDAPQELRS